MTRSLLWKKGESEFAVCVGQGAISFMCHTFLSACSAQHSVLQISFGGKRDEVPKTDSEKIRPFLFFIFLEVALGD